jgi:hypothetical protein
VVCPGPAAENDRRKPSEMYEIMENFCQGIRRIELFGDDRSARPGWLTRASCSRRQTLTKQRSRGTFGKNNTCRATRESKRCARKRRRSRKPGRRTREFDLENALKENAA